MSVRGHVRVVAPDDGRLYIVAPCGCTVRVSAEDSVVPIEVGDQVLAVLGHVIGKTACARSGRQVVGG